MRTVQETLQLLWHYKAFSGVAIVQAVKTLLTATGLGDFGLPDEQWKAIEASLDGLCWLVAIVALKGAHDADPYDNGPRV